MILNWIKTGRRKWAAPGLALPVGSGRPLTSNMPDNRFFSFLPEGEGRRRRQRTLPCRNGFTLIELVISSALMSLILAGAYLCLRAGVSGQKLVESRAGVLQNARVALAIMSADLRAACPLAPEFEFLGMRRLLGEVEADNLDFATYNHSPRNPGEFDFCRISYYLDENRESGRFTLLRRRNPDPAGEPLEGGVREEIAEGLTGMRLEYYDGFQWYEDWGDQEGRQQEQYSWTTRWNLYGMPEAVRITLFFDSNPRASKSREEETEPPLVLQTVVQLNLAGAVWPERGAGGGQAEGEAMPGIPVQGGR